MADAIERDVAALLKLLREMTELHEQWAELGDAKREALASGDADALTAVCRLENEKLQAVSEREKRRLELVASLTRAVKPDAGRPLRLAELAELMPEPTRGRLLLARQGLRERIKVVKTQSSIARRATDSLMKHMNTLVQGVAAAATGASTYTPRGGTAPRGLTLGTLNTTA